MIDNSNVPKKSWHFTKKRQPMDPDWFTFSTCYTSPEPHRTPTGPLLDPARPCRSLDLSDPRPQMDPNRLTMDNQPTCFSFHHSTHNDRSPLLTFISVFLFPIFLWRIRNNYWLATMLSQCIYNDLCSYSAKGIKISGWLTPLPIFLLQSPIPMLSAVFCLHTHGA